MFKVTTVIVLRRVWRYQRGQSESVCRRRTDNTMPKRKSTKGQTTLDPIKILIKGFVSQ